jgi:hypothetical protein
LEPEKKDLEASQKKIWRLSVSRSKDGKVGSTRLLQLSRSMVIDALVRPISITAPQIDRAQRGPINHNPNSGRSRQMTEAEDKAGSLAASKENAAANKAVLPKKDSKRPPGTRSAAEENATGTTATTARSLMGWWLHAWELPCRDSQRHNNSPMGIAPNMDQQQQQQEQQYQQRRDLHTN